MSPEPTLIHGFNPVLEALRAGRVRTLRVVRSGGRRLEELVRQAREHGVPVHWAERQALDRMASGRPHQGVVAEVDLPAAETLDSLVRGAAGPPLLLVLDGIEDPHNLGAILRTADAAGATGVVRQTRHAAPLGPTVARASAGAISHVRIADVVNVARALEELKELGIWTVGLASEAPVRIDQVDLTGPTALVVGAEGTGLRRLVRERCDWLAAIPMRGRLASLNVSVASGIALFEAVRQRSLGEGPSRPYNRS